MSPEEIQTRVYQLLNALHKAYFIRPRQQNEIDMEEELKQLQTICSHGEVASFQDWGSGIEYSCIFCTKKAVIENENYIFKN